MRTPAPHKQCRECAGYICKDNRSGLCRVCINADPEFIANRAEAIRKAFMADPRKRERHRQAVTEANRRPERREMARRTCLEQRLWERGLLCMTPEVRARQARTRSNQLLAHIPLERRDEYRSLAKAYGAAEAERIIREHQEAVLRRGRA